MARVAPLTRNLTARSTTISVGSLVHLARPAASCGSRDTSTPPGREDRPVGALPPVRWNGIMSQKIAKFCMIIVLHDNSKLTLIIYYRLACVFVSSLIFHRSPHTPFYLSQPPAPATTEHNNFLESFERPRRLLVADCTTVPSTCCVENPPEEPCQCHANGGACNGDTDPGGDKICKWNGGTGCSVNPSYVFVSTDKISLKNQP